MALRPLAIADAAAIAAAASESRERFPYIRVPDGVEEAQRDIEVVRRAEEARRRAGALNRRTHRPATERREPSTAPSAVFATGRARTPPAA